MMKSLHTFIVRSLIGSLQYIRVTMSRCIAHLFGILSSPALVKLPSCLGLLALIHLLQHLSSNIMCSVPLLNGSLFTFFIVFQIKYIISLRAFLRVYPTDVIVFWCMVWYNEMHVSHYRQMTFASHTSRTTFLHDCFSTYNLNFSSSHAICEITVHSYLFLKNKSFSFLIGVISILTLKPKYCSLSISSASISMLFAIISP